MFTIKINSVDIRPYIKHGGVKWTRSDIDGPNAGRDMSGEMIRDYVATKIRFDISCRPLTQNELATVLSLIKPTTLFVTYTDLETNTVKTGSFYSNNFSTSIVLTQKNGTEYWDGLTFPLIEF